MPSRDRRERVRGGTKIVPAITMAALAAIGVVSALSNQGAYVRATSC
jgi:hypothetical protein